MVEVEQIGDPTKIVSGTTKITRDPVGLRIAALAAKVVKNSGYLKRWIFFPDRCWWSLTGSCKICGRNDGKDHIKGSFCMGGITGYLVDMANKGYFDTILDVQCFDLKAIESIRENPKHQEISAMRYASPAAKSAAVDSLDVVILGATQVDTDFNVNVHTDSNGNIMGGSGGHCDTAAGAKLAIVVAPLIRARLPLIVDQVLCKSTPGDTIDVIVNAERNCSQSKTERIKRKINQSRSSG